ncbi:MAG: antibiotic biosynthesis monooxygenase [Candidatus Contendobacter sp.]|jgi:quinol monooxygenase YgiN|nr:antibiotic biosynthesis monooxygenase [Gammaproteobacteria bacterium]MCC8994746.1 antibiotic biosynthesis monooxygenase [Candidatus Contendobacter sp.]
MSSPAVHVIARLTARPDTVARLQIILAGLLEPTRRETGCRSYTLLHNLADPTDFTFVEEWADAAALDAHLQTPHLQTALAQAVSLLTTDPDIRRYVLI